MGLSTPPRYTQENPKWVQASSVTRTSSGLVNVVAYGRQYDNCITQSGKMLGELYTLVEDPNGGWLHVWFWERDIQT
jgi:hypothetical protein